MVRHRLDLNQTVHARPHPGFPASRPPGNAVATIATANCGLHHPLRHD